MIAAHHLSCLFSRLSCGLRHTSAINCSMWSAWCHFVICLWGFVYARRTRRGATWSSSGGTSWFYRSLYSLQVNTRQQNPLFSSVCLCVFSILTDGVWSPNKAARAPKKCGAPVAYPHTKLASKYSDRQHFNFGEKVYYDCADDFTASSRAFRAVKCLQGGWSKLNLKCESKFSACWLI